MLPRRREQRRWTAGRSPSARSTHRLHPRGFFSPHLARFIHLDLVCWQVGIKAVLDHRVALLGPMSRPWIYSSPGSPQMHAGKRESCQHRFFWNKRNSSCECSPFVLLLYARPLGDGASFSSLLPYISLCSLGRALHTVFPGALIRQHICAKPSCCMCYSFC